MQSWELKHKPADLGGCAWSPPQMPTMTAWTGHGLISLFQRRRGQTEGDPRNSRGVQMGANVHGICVAHAGGNHTQHTLVVCRHVLLK